LKKEETAKKMLSIVEEEYINNARKQMNMDCLSNYNFAITGATGTGKSSLINALCDRDEVDDNAAEVGITETTSVVKAYPHPTRKHLVFWDLPGGGTATHPSRSYFQDKYLLAFDCLVICSAGRLVELDIDIAREAAKHRIPFLLVRTKKDADINSTKKKIRMMEKKDSKKVDANNATGNALDEKRIENLAIQQVRQGIDKSYEEQLAQIGVFAKIYILSAETLRDPQRNPPLMDELDFFHELLASARGRKNFRSDFWSSYYRFRSV